AAIIAYRSAAEEAPEGPWFALRGLALRRRLAYRSRPAGRAVALQPVQRAGCGPPRLRLVDAAHDRLVLVADPHVLRQAPRDRPDTREVGRDVRVVLAGGR